VCVLLLVNQSQLIEMLGNLIHVRSQFSQFKSSEQSYSITEGENDASTRSPTLSAPLFDLLQPCANIVGICHNRYLLDLVKISPVFFERVSLKGIL